MESKLGFSVALVTYVIFILLKALLNRRRKEQERRGLMAHVDNRLRLFLLIVLFVWGRSAHGQQQVFVSESTGMIEAFTANSAGILSPVPGSPFNERSAPTALAINPSGNLLFAANSAASNISVFTIQSSGLLSEVAMSPFGAGDATSPQALAVSTDGKLLFVASATSTANPQIGLLDIYAINADGSLNPVVSLEAPANPVGIFIHPNGRFVYVYGGDGAGVIQGYTVQSATLAPMPPFLSGQFPNALIGNITGTFLFAAYGRNEGFGYIDSLAVNLTDGSLSVASTFNTQQFSFAVTNLALDSTGQFLYTNNGVFSVGVDGLLTSIPNVLGSGPASPLYASPVNLFLFQGSEASALPPAIYPFVIASDGSLTNSETPLTLAGTPTAIVGTGTATISVSTAAGFTPSALNFSNVITDQSSSQIVQLFNIGTTALAIDNLFLAGSNYFSETNSCPTSLAPNLACGVSVTFSPLAVGNFTATLNLSSNAPSVSVSLTGGAINPEPFLTISPGSLSFPSTILGADSPSQTVSLSNAGTASLHFTAIGLASANSGDFYQDNNCTDLPVKAKCTITAVFSPQAQGLRTTSIVLITNDPSSPSFISLSGMGTASVTTAVVGSGSIIQAPTGSMFANPTNVTFTAQPGQNATFLGWAGGCTGTALVCSLAITTNTNVTAMFSSVTPPPPPPPAPSITVSPTSQSGKAGQSFSFQIATANFPSAPTLAVSAAIPNGQCTVSNSAVICTTTAPSSNAELSLPRNAIGFLLAAVGLGALPKRKRLTLAVGLGLAICTACSGGGAKSVPSPPVVTPTPGTPAGAYQITLTASMNSERASTQATLTITQ